MLRSGRNTASLIVTTLSRRAKVVDHDPGTKSRTWESQRMSRITVKYAFFEPRTEGQV